MWLLPPLQILQSGTANSEISLLSSLPPPAVIAASIAQVPWPLIPANTVSDPFASIHFQPTQTPVHSLFPRHSSLSTTRVWHCCLKPWDKLLRYQCMLCSHYVFLSAKWNLPKLLGRTWVFLNRRSCSRQLLFSVAWAHWKDYLPGLGEESFVEESRCHTQHQTREFFCCKSFIS